MSGRAAVRSCRILARGPRRQAGAALARPWHFEDTGAGAYPTKTINNSPDHFKTKERIMKNPLDSLWGTVIAGVVLTVVLVVFARNFLG
jgi:hypothetical protein